MDQIYKKIPSDYKDKIVKNYCKGGFLYKITNEDDPLDYHWVCRDN